jgi:predicted neuraminidase
MRTVIAAMIALAASAEQPFLTSEIIFPLEHWHNHASTIVELPNGDLLTCWFHGSGERTADDVLVLGARLKKDDFVPPASVTPDAQEGLPRKTIKHAHFNEAWIKEGDR